MKTALLALVALTVVTYLPALHNEFIWDDDDHFTANRAMTAPDGLRQIWTSLKVSRYYPLTLTTFWVQRRLWGLEPLPYHAVNIALHATSAALLFLLLRRIGVLGAWMGAALWAIHPVNVESVAWATELKNVQSGLFFFATVLCYLRFESSADRRWYALAVIGGAAAMLSKPSTVMLPAVLLLLAWWQRGRVTRKDLVRALPFVAVALVMSGIAIIEQHIAVRDEVRDWSLTFPQRFAVASRAVCFYAGKLLWPVRLSFIYPRWNAAFSWMAVVGLIAAVALLRRRRAGIFGVVFFLAALAPVLGWFDVYFFRYSFVADHFQYLASVGPLALGAAGVAGILRQQFARRLVAGVVLAFLATLSWQRCGVFHDNERLWRDTVAKNPDAFLAYNNLGLMAAGRRQFPEAEALLRESLRAKPDYIVAHNNLGLVFGATGRRVEALEQFREAVRLNPRDPVAHGNLGLSLAQTGQPQEALVHFREAVRLEPMFTTAHENLANLWLAMGNTNAAIQQYRDALTASPDWTEGRQRLAELSR